MSQPRRSSWRKQWHLLIRKGFAKLPRSVRFAVFRRLIDCDPSPDARLVLKVAETREELEACFKILHDAYVGAGFMNPHPSGLRATIYHALPTTTTLCAKWDGRVVGTISMIRDGVFGFPMQSVFDLTAVRAQPGQIAEISALAVHPDFRKTGGAILFPLMKFMYEYCVRFFDTRHIVIAVNPDRIEMYEALLLFERLQAQTVDAYDFANGAPAVGAVLDLRHIAQELAQTYGGRARRKNLHHYFIESQLACIQWPKRRYRTTNDAVMTPALLDHFFNQRTQALASLDDRKKALLWSIYQMAEYRQVLPMLASGEVPASGQSLRQQVRHTLLCPGELTLSDGSKVEIEVVEVALGGLQARSKHGVSVDEVGVATVKLGPTETSELRFTVRRKVRDDSEHHYFGCRIEESDAAWRRCVATLESALTAADVHAD